MKLLDVVARVQELTGDAPYAVVGGLAQILWARKTHTDDLDVVVSSPAFISFKNDGFNHEILATAAPVPDLGGIRFIRPELLLVTHLLRPGPVAALSAIELVLARRAHGGMNVDEARHWAAEVNRVERLEHVLTQAVVLDSV